MLLLAPVFGESLSGSTPPLTLLLPWNLAFMAGLYGCGALLCRELVVRSGLGLSGLVLLGAAYGVLEEGLVDRYWFYPRFWHDVGVGRYSVVWDTNVLLAVHLTLFHAAVSVTASVLVVQCLFPVHVEPWLPRWALVPVGLVLFALIPFLYGEFGRGPDLAHHLATGALLLALAAAAYVAPRRPARPREIRFAGTIAFACTAAHFVAVYSMPSTGLPWPVGVLVSVLPVAVGFVVLRRVDPFRVVRGILAFFVVLGCVIGLGGSYDSIVLALVLSVALLRWGRQTVPNSPT